ncbi:MAG: glycosyltransferase family 4 protein [Bacilli bacterium]
MKICFVHEEYPEETNFGGIATYQKIMAEYYANTGDEVIVVTRGKKNLEYYENNVHIFRIASTNDNNNIDSIYEFRKKVAEILIELQDKKLIDIIETPDWGASTIFFEKYRKVPLVVRLHTPLKIWLMYNNNSFGEAKDTLLDWEAEMLQNADLITSCSKLLKEKVINDYPIKKDIVVIPNPCNITEFNLKNCSQNNDMIYVGSLEERKGVLVLAEAINEVFAKVDNIHLFVVGKDTTRNKKIFLQRIICWKKLIKNIIIEFHSLGMLKIKRLMII